MTWVGRLFGWQQAPQRKNFDPYGDGAPALRSLNLGGVFGRLDLSNLAEAPTTDARRIALVGSHPVAFLCVRKISWSAASVPWRANYQGKEIPFDHPIVRLLNKPDPTRSRWETYQLLAASLAVTGNAYLLKVPAAVFDRDQEMAGKDSGLPGALLFMRPDRVKPYVNSRNVIEYYDYYNFGNSAHQRLSPADVIHIRHAWLSDDHMGFSLMSAAYEPIALYAGLVTLARKIANNLGGLPGMLVFTRKEGMSDTQREEMQGHLERFKTDGDKFAELLLVDAADGDVKHIPIGGDISKLQPIQSKADAARETAGLFGVPPILLSQGEGATFANMEEANRSFWLETVVPGYLRPIGDAIGNALGLGVEPDLSEVSALAALNQQVVAMLNAASFLTINEKRAVAGYEGVPMGDRIMSSMGQVPLDTQIATSDANAVTMYDPALLQSIIDAANQTIDSGKSADVDVLRRVVALMKGMLGEAQKAKKTGA